MKKIILLFFTILFFSSCKKNYTCTCEYTKKVETLLPGNTTKTENTSSTTTYIIEAKSETRAADDCNHYEMPATNTRNTLNTITTTEKKVCEI